MPSRIYRGQNPPRFIDHVLAHPWEMSAAAYGVIGGVLGLVAIIGNGSVSPSLSRLPAPLVAAMCVLLVGGGVQIFRGLFDQHEDLMIGWTKERVGLAMLGSGWLVYAVTVFAARPSAVLAWGLGLSFTIGAGLRLWATFHEESATREAS